jgi:hypothetical protein
MSRVTTLPARGAYGLRIAGIGRPELLNAGVPAGWRPVRFEHREGTAYADVSVDDGRAVFPCGADGVVTADRGAGTVTVTAPRPVSDDELAHPYLAWAASAFARWYGWEAYHAGGVVAGAAVWGVTGDRGTGKSTLLAALALQGGGVVSDDLLVVQGGRALAGPRCVDLRDDAARALDAGRPVETEGRERLRVALGAVPAELPLAGWVLLSWGERAGLRRVRPPEALVRLGAQRMMQLHEVRPEGLLDQLGRPVLELVRPRDFAQLEASVELLSQLG